jgi:hypothetical protein
LFAGDAMDQIVSDFFISTSSMNIKPNVNKLTRWMLDDLVARSHVAGSVSELYVETLLSCVGDLDMMGTAKHAVVVQSVLSDEYNLPYFSRKR